MLGNSVFMVGGNDGTDDRRVERATIDAMGNLGAFATVSGVTLTAGRESAALVVAAGNRCFVIGGKFAAGGTASIEQMRIDTGSALQPFADAGTHLLSARG